MRRATTTIVGPVVAVVLVACGGGGGDEAAATGAVAGDVTVFAAASLIDAFEALGDAFETAHPGATVTFGFAGSSSLQQQILAGAPADVFASADPAAMDAVVDGGAVRGTPVRFATNVLVIAVPAGNPAGVGAVADLTDHDLLVGLCAPEVPCGRLARRLLASSGVQPAVDTEEPDVRSLLTKIAAGELDAGIVYTTDIMAADGSVERVPIPGSAQVPATYPIAVLTDGSNRPGAKAFVELVTSGAGRAILAEHGFGPP